MNIRFKNLSNLSTLNLSNKYAEIPSLYINNCPSISNWNLLKSIYNTQGNTLKYINLDLGSVTGTEADIDMLYAFIQQAGGVNNYGRVTRSDEGVYSDDISQFPALTGTLTVAKAHSTAEAKITAIQQALGVTVTIGGYYVDFFGDAVAEQLAATAWGDGIGVTAAEAAAVTTIGTTFKASSITDLRWIKWFTSITSIPTNAFQNCSSLGDCGTVEWPSGITYFYDLSFSGCSSLNLSSLPNQLTSIGSYCFDGCVSLTLSQLPDTVVSIGGVAFRSTKVSFSSLPSGITVINSYVFTGCTKLCLTSLPSGVSRIGACAFEACLLLNITSLPISVTSIERSAFLDCTGIQYLVINNPTPPSVSSDASFGRTSFPFYVPAESVDTYKSASGWSSYADRIFAIPSES